MATVVPCASCYGSNRVQQLGFFNRGPGGGYMSLLSNHGPRGAPPPTLARHAPNMTLRQICHLLRLMRQIRRREAAAAAAATRKQAAGLTTPSSPSAKHCLPGFLRRRRTNNIKRSGALLLDYREWYGDDTSFTIVWVVICSAFKLLDQFDAAQEKKAK